MSYNEDFYALGHLSKFVAPGAHVVASSTYGNGSVQTVAFRNPDAGHALLALNSGDHDQGLTVSCGGKWLDYTLPAGAVGTFTW